MQRNKRQKDKEQKDKEQRGQMNQKTIGAIIAIIGGVGAVASIGVMFLIQGSCPLVMDFYHQALLVLMPVFFAILVLGVYLFFKPEEVRVKRVVSARKIERILTPDERRIIEFLKGKKDVTQADIRKSLDMPRATLTVLLQRMEKRKLIRKEKIGKTNYVVPMKGF
jgi:uncharacterized membrane protein